MKYLYRRWKRGCANLEIEGIVLFGGTPNSTVRGLRKMRNSEEIKKGSIHSTKRSLNRHF